MGNTESINPPIRGSIEGVSMKNMNKMNGLNPPIRGSIVFSIIS